jgi:small subunit ribosomal protein S21
LSEVVISENDSFEAALRRFSKKVQHDGILSEARRREHYEKPSVRRKKKEAAKRRKTARAAGSSRRS